MWEPEGGPPLGGQGWLDTGQVVEVVAPPGGLPSASFPEPVGAFIPVPGLPPMEPKLEAEDELMAELRAAEEEEAQGGAAAESGRRRTSGTATDR